MQLRQLEIFHAVMTTGSISSAARLMNITQPGVSKIIKQLERNLGFNLFTRIGGRLRASPEAMTLFAETQTLYAQMENIRTLAHNLGRGIGQKSIRISSTTGMAHDILPMAIQLFRKTSPDCKVELHTANTKSIIEALVQREVDIGFAPSPPIHPAIETRNLTIAELVCITPRSFVHTRNTFRLKDFEGKELIAMHHEDPLAMLFHGACNTEEVSITSKITVRTYLMACSLVEKGEGIAVIDQHTALSRHINDLKLYRLNPALNFSISAMWLKDTEPSLLMKEFINSFQLAERHLSQKLPERTGHAH